MQKHKLLANKEISNNLSVSLRNHLKQWIANYQTPKNVLRVLKKLRQQIMNPLVNICLISLFVVLAGCSQKTVTQEESELTTTLITPAGYTNITSEELFQLMQQEDIYLVDTHIPEQQHIRGTDAFIPYNEILARADELPKNKKIVLYCRSGSMSKIASEKLSDAGFTNVYNLIGGTNDWWKNGMPFE